ncbi:MAG: MFS transporter, partial [Clostridia bacterium]|nr:MFS transporter [Clostridia bacterium]
MKKTKYPRGVYVAMICLSMLFAVTYSVPYVKSVFYDGMLAMTKVSNEKLGILMTIYGLGEILTLGIGGVIANRFNHRAIIVISSLGTALGCLLFALFPSFAMSLIVWTILVFSTLFMVWGTLFKAMRLMVSDEQQGELAGWFAGLIGLNYLIVNIVCLGVYSLFGKGNDVAGMKAVFYTFAILMVIFTFVTSFALKKVGIRNETALAEA